MTAQTRVHFAGEAPSRGYYVAPHIFELAGAEALTEEVFGPILHVVRYRADDLDGVQLFVWDCNHPSSQNCRLEFSKKNKRLQRRKQKRKRPPAKPAGY